MAIVCSNCEVAPGASAQPGSACGACGERLIIVDTTDDLVGQKIDGRFEVLAPLGKGGMGVVYRARQLSIGREIALKVLDRRIEKDVKSVQRFFREAKLASTLQHPNTVPIIDFGQNTDGRLFLAMELINGSTLLDAINAGGAMPVPRVVEIGVQLCDALEAAHDLHIVHRDLKLENAMLLAGKRDHVKVLDFGLARSLVDPSTAMTATGLVSGTPRYMAPEVALDGAAPAPSQDMYALGVMLAEMSIGRPLWGAQSLELLFTKKLDTETSIAEVPAALKPLVRLLLSNEPGMRPTAGQTRSLLRDLDARTAVDLELDLPGRPGLPRADSPIALEPTTDVNVAPSGIDIPISTSDIKVEVSTTPDPFAALATAGVVALDELPQATQGDAKLPASIAPAPTIKANPPPPAADDYDPRFSIPEHHEIKAEQLQIDKAYLKERSAKLTARRNAPPPVVVKRPSRLPALIVALLLIGGVGGGGYYYWFHVRARHDRLPGAGITITVQASGEREIFVDGRPAGKTPVRLQLPKGTTPITITGPGVVDAVVVPDHDQTVVLQP